jgi:hypothetical protein
VNILEEAYFNSDWSKSEGGGTPAVRSVKSRGEVAGYEYEICSVLYGTVRVRVGKIRLDGAEMVAQGRNGEEAPVQR